MTLQFDETSTLLALSRLFKPVVHTFVVLLHEDVMDSAVTAVCYCGLERFLW